MTDLATGPAATAAERARRVFELPSETTLRFFLLVAAVVLASLFTYESLYYTVHEEREQEVLRQCQVAAKTIGDPVLAQSREFACRAPSQRRRVLWTAQFLPVTLGVACGVGSLLPSLRRRRRKLSVLPEIGALGARVEQLAARLELERIPRLSWQPRRVGGAATAFGLPWRPELEVSPGTVVLGAIDPVRCDAIVGHEMAHLRNRDIFVGGFAAASFVAFLVVAAVPFLIGVVASDIPVVVVLTSVVRLALLAGLVAVVQRGALRAREHEADVRAASAGVDVGPGITAPMPAPVGWCRRLARPLESHPSSESRVRILEHPELLLRPSPLQAAAAGFLAFLPIPTVGRLASGYLSASSGINEGLLWAAAALSVPIGVWLAIAAVRQAADPGSSVGTSIAIGASVALGAVTALLLYQDSLYQKVTFLEGGATEIIGLGLLSLTLVGFVVWVFELTRSAVGSTQRSRLRVLALVLIAALGAAVLVGQLARVWFMSRITQDGGAVGKDPVLAVAELVFATVATPWVAVLLATVTLAALALGTRPDRRRMLVLVAIGLCAGLVGFVALRVMEERLAAIASKEMREQRLLSIRFVMVAPVLVAACSVGAFVVSAWRAKERSLHLSLACALIAALVGSGAVMLLQRSRGVPFGSAQLQTVLVPIVVYALLGCIAAGALITAVRLPGSSWVGVGLVGMVLLVGAPGAAAYVAAPAALLEEVPPFEAWLAGDAAPVLEVLDVCHSFSTAPLPPDQAPQLGLFATQAVTVVDSSNWRTADLRRETELLRQALAACSEGSVAAGTGRPGPAEAAFKRSLCLSNDFYSFLSGLEGRPTPRVAATEQVCD